LLFVGCDNRFFCFIHRLKPPQILGGLIDVSAKKTGVSN
jgi:hypothetical protein